MIRDIDHIILPVSNLAQARSRLSMLGFTVAADARHPFGTENACVFFGDGRYLEPLAIGDADVYSAQSQAGNVFVCNDDLFRWRRGPEGFSGIVAKAEDALADHQCFLDANMSGGAPLFFSRPVTLPDGVTSEASFRLSFAGDGESSDVFFATCQRMSGLPAAQSDLARHDNGVIGIREVILSAKRPLDVTPVVETVFGASGDVDSEGNVCFRIADIVIRVVAPSTAQGMFDNAHQQTGGRLAGEGIVFSVSDLAVTETLLAANGVEYTRKGARLLVQRASGQGATFAFEE